MIIGMWGDAWRREKWRATAEIGKEGSYFTAIGQQAPRAGGEPQGQERPALPPTGDEHGHTGTLSSKQGEGGL